MKKRLSRNIPKILSLGILLVSVGVLFKGGNLLRNSKKSEIISIVNNNQNEKELKDNYLKSSNFHDKIIKVSEGASIQENKRYWKNKETVNLTLDEEKLLSYISENKIGKSEIKKITLDELELIYSNRVSQGKNLESILTKLEKEEVIKSESIYKLNYQGIDKQEVLNDKEIAMIFNKNKDKYISLKEMENIYLENNFNSDYQELLRDGILAEKSNGVVYKKSLFSSNEYFFILMTLLFFVSIVVRLVRDRQKIMEFMDFEDILQENLDYSNLNEEIEKFPKDSIIKEEWESYINTFYVGKENKRYETVDPDLYFNFDVLYKDQIRYKIYTYMPQTIVGLGMLGTFYGLSTGLSQLDLSNVDSIQNGVGDLLSGVKTAFYTSLFGLTYSILFSLFNSAYFSEIERTVVNIKNKIRKLAKKNINEEAVDRIIEVLEGIKSSNNDMATRLGNRIDYMAGSLSSNIQAFSEEVKSSNDNMAVRLGSSLESMAESLNTNIQAFSDSIGHNFQEELSGSLDKIFNEDFLGNMNSSLNNISDVFLENSKKMVEFKDEMKDLTRDLLELKTSYSSVIEETYSLKDSFNKSMENINSHLLDITKEVNQVANKYEETSENLSEVLESIVSTQEKTVLVQDTNIAILEENKEVMKVAESLLMSSKDILEAEKSVQELWSAYEETFKEVNSSLSDNLNIYKENLDETVVKLGEILRENSTEYNNFIKTQTVDYTTEIRKGMIDLFTDYDQNLSSVINKFNGVLLNFNEKIDDFSDLILETKETIEKHNESLNNIEGEN